MLSSRCDLLTFRGRQPRHAIYASLLVLTAAGSLCAAEPVLRSLVPWGVQRGTQVELQLHGDRLDDAEALLVYQPGLEPAELQVESGQLVRAQLKVDANCPLGPIGIRVRTRSGVSNLRTLSVTALPIVAETEPNSDFREPQPVALDQTLAGTVTNEDVDYFVVEARQGERISVEIEGLRLGTDQFFDPYVAILNTDRFELARADDTALVRQDALCSLVAPSDGRYIIEIRETAFGGNDNCRYLAHVGRYPRPVAVLPAGGRPGETIQATVIDALGEPRQAAITLPTGDATEYAWHDQTETGIAPSANRLRVVDLPNVLEAEPNNDTATATVASVPAALGGVIAEAGDIDFFRFTAKQGEVIDIQVYAREVLRSPLDSVLNVYDANGKSLAGNDDNNSPDSYLRFNPPADGDYHVSVTDHLRSGSPVSAYRVEITPVQPQLTISLPERQQYVATTLSVPQGNRMALMVAAQRRDVGGEVVLEFPDLPEGVTWESFPMAEDRGDVPVLFSAPADAQLAGSLVPVRGQIDRDPPLVGRLSQRTMLVRGQNNRDVWGHTADRMASVLTEKVPFSLEIVPPKVPLVRNGSLDLKVRATRDEGFTAPIALQLLYTPPGVGASGSVQIPGDQQEAVIPLTANNGAATGVWKIIVTGRAGGSSGTLEVATPFAPLTIAEHFFDVAFEKAAVEQGQSAEFVVTVTPRVEFPETAQVELVGLPAGTASEPQEITAATEKIVFPVTAQEDARPGRYKSIFCRSVIMREGEPITQTLGTGELRVDKPLPPPEDQETPPGDTPQP